MEIPRLVVSDGKGNIYDIEELEMVGFRSLSPVIPKMEELIPLPEGSDLFELPGRVPLGFDRQHNEFISLVEDEPIFPVAAFLAPAYTQILRAAYQTANDAPMLPLYAYTAVGYADGKFWVPAIRVDDDTRQDLAGFSDHHIEKGAQKMLRRYPKNRLVQHIVDNCVRQYKCPAARNFVLNRWEAPIPTSKTCNARCVGCISLQEEESGLHCAQNRISFLSTAKEIAEFTVPHLETAKRAIVSFGQGCEGEPLTNGKLLEDSIAAIRAKTEKGTINLNTNGSLPDIVEKLCKTGLDSIRISMNSAQENFYNQYFNPQGYTFDDVLQSLKICREYNIWISLNYFIFPGFTDQIDEVEALCKLIEKFPVDYIQMRNLNIDPDLYIETLGVQAFMDEPIGILSWMDVIKKKFPQIRFGYFNPPKEDFQL